MTMILVRTVHWMWDEVSRAIGERRDKGAFRWMSRLVGLVGGYVWMRRGGYS